MRKIVARPYSLREILLYSSAVDSPIGRQNNQTAQNLAGRNYEMSVLGGNKGSQMGIAEVHSRMKIGEGW